MPFLYPLILSFSLWEKGRSFLIALLLYFFAAFMASGVYQIGDE